MTTDTIKFGGRTFARQHPAARTIPTRGPAVPNNPGMGYFVRKGEQQHITENYVCTPPALTITDSLGAVWALGFNTVLSRGEFAYDVLRNGIFMGEKANRIEMRAGKISIFGPEGRKAWTGHSFI